MYKVVTGFIIYDDPALECKVGDIIRDEATVKRAPAGCVIKMHTEKKRVLREKGADK